MVSTCSIQTPTFEHWHYQISPVSVCFSLKSPILLSAKPPTNDISIEFEIRPKFAVLWFKMYSTDHNKNLYTSRQCNCRDVCKISLRSVKHNLNLSIPNFDRISNSIEISLVGWAPGQLGAGANFDDRRRQGRRSQMFIKHAFEFRCDVIFTGSQFWPWGIVVACICPSVSPSMIRHQLCPCDNSLPVQARITKFGP